MYLDMIRDFERMIRGEDNSCITLEEAASIVELIRRTRNLNATNPGAQ
jgi:hypothetical protein